jgi:hypothetical protein
VWKEKMMISRYGTVKVVQRAYSQGEMFPQESLETFTFKDCAFIFDEIAVSIYSRAPNSERDELVGVFWDVESVYLVEAEAHKAPAELYVVGG